MLKNITKHQIVNKLHVCRECLALVETNNLSYSNIMHHSCRNLDFWQYGLFDPLDVLLKCLPLAACIKSCITILNFLVHSEHWLGNVYFHALLELEVRGNRYTLPE